MRALLCALALALVLPATASAQTFVAQDLSIAGAVVASPDPLERTVRFTVTNHGPGPVDGYAYLTVERLLATSILAAPGCTVRTVVGSPIDARCELGAGIPENESRSVDIALRFTGNDLVRDQIVGTAGVASSTGGLPVGDRDGTNNQVTVDLGLVVPPPSMKLDVLVPRLQHGTQARILYLVTNTGGVPLTDVRVTDDGCASPQSSNGVTTIPPRLGPQSTLSFTCIATTPAHRKGEKPHVHHVVATAQAGGQVLRSEQTAAGRYVEPVRQCGSFALARGGKRRTYDATTAHPDVKCKTARRQLARCLRRHKAPEGFTCRTYANGKLAYLRPKPFTGADWLRAARR